MMAGKWLEILFSRIHDSILNSEYDLNPAIWSFEDPRIIRLDSKN
jgi:hypothetical protein